jgi:hypothetical protein
MARKTNTSNPATLPSKSDLGLSDLRVRLNFLEKENDKTGKTGLFVLFQVKIRIPTFHERS